MNNGQDGISHLETWGGHWPSHRAGVEWGLGSGEPWWPKASSRGGGRVFGTRWEGGHCRVLLVRVLTFISLSP